MVAYHQSLEKASIIFIWQKNTSSLNIPGSASVRVWTANVCFTCIQRLPFHIESYKSESESCQNFCLCWWRKAFLWLLPFQQNLWGVFDRITEMMSGERDCKWRGIAWYQAIPLSWVGLYFVWMYWMIFLLKINGTPGFEWYFMAYVSMYISWYIICIHVYFMVYVVGSESREFSVFEVLPELVKFVTEKSTGIDTG